MAAFPCSTRCICPRGDWSSDEAPPRRRARTGRLVLDDAAAKNRRRSLETNFTRHCPNGPSYAGLICNRGARPRARPISKSPLAIWSSCSARRRRKRPPKPPDVSQATIPGSRNSRWLNLDHFQIRLSCNLKPNLGHCGKSVRTLHRSQDSAENLRFYRSSESTPRARLSRGKRHQQHSL